MSAPRKWTEEESKRLRLLNKQGLTLNECARVLERSPNTVSTHGRKLGLSWSTNNNMLKAHSAMREEGRRRREQLMEDLLGDAEKLRKRLWEPETYHDWGGKDHEYDERDRSEPIASDKLRLMQSVKEAVSTIRSLEQVDNEQAAEAARSMLVNLAERMGVTGPAS